MLSDKEKRKIRNLDFFEISFKEKNGKPITFDDKEFYIPSFEEMRKAVFKEIIELGFSKIKRVSPDEANCIIRLYKKLHYVHNEEFIYNLYGADCFVLKSGKWVSDNNGRYKIDYSDHTIKYWIHQGEFIDFECDFFDCYVKIIS